MKVSLNWVKEFTDVHLSVDELTMKIGAQLGAVEEVVDLGKKYQGIVIAKVVSCAKHSDADKLQVCTIDDGGNTPSVNRGQDGYVQVVCGAPNVREGMLVAWLPPGSTVPSSYDKEPFVLEAREIRGVVSHGMLASAHELALSDDSSGIVELSYGEPGTDFAKEFGLDDYIIDIENKMFTHRPDLFGILGIAREIAGITGQQFKSPEWYLGTDSKVESQKSKDGLKLEVKNNIQDLVPRFMAQIVESVDVKSSPIWMQAYLSRVGIRPINNIVDVTNYTMYLTAQPLHAYDYDKLCKVADTKHARLETRLSKKGDKLKLLNGKTISFEDDQTILVTSNDVPVGIAGVMGGADTEVDETTKNIVLECANFDMYAIRRASMRHGLFTDAVTRFNKGQSSLQNTAVLLKSAGWITDLAGGIAADPVDDFQEKEHAVTVLVTTEFINNRLGLNLPADDMAQLLTNVEFKVEITQPDLQLLITAPFWRTDIEIPEDVVEEIGRLHGYDNLPLVLPRRDLIPANPDPLLTLKTTIRGILARAGVNEVLTYSFVHGNLIDRAGQDRDQAFKLSNALSPDLQYYRMSLTPSLLDKVHLNIKAGYDQLALFEIGKVHIKSEVDVDGLPVEFERVACVYAANDKTVNAVAGAAYYQAQKFALNVLAGLGITEFKLESYDLDLSNNLLAASRAAPYATSRRSAILANLNGQDNVFIGIIGEFTGLVISKLKLPKYSAGFELETTLLHQLREHNAKSSYRPLSKFPKVEQDISLKVPAATPYSSVYGLLATQLLQPENAYASLMPLDIYQREEDQDHKQLTFRFIITHYQKTLTSEEVNKMLDIAAAAASDSLHAERL